MKVLVTGGAGYIGSHMCKLLARHGHELVVLDSFVTGHRDAVRWGALVEGSLLDGHTLDAAFARGPIDAVIHFAGSIAVGESVREPLAYYRNNVGGSLALLEAMHRHGVRRLVFSSTAAVYGTPQYSPLDERHPTVPVNPYGHSKLMIEQVLRDAAAAGTVDAIALRYFNACGADADCELGERHEPETHLIPLLLQRLLGLTAEFRVYGEDYPTPDGTCIRDYIHVGDLCAAHLAACARLGAGLSGFHAFNLGTGRGYSVREIIAATEAVTGRKIAPTIAGRRPGDPPALVASSALAQRELGWKPAMTDIQEVIASAWRWHQHHGR
jgi:UDP-glucose-4-epimerase GalE